MAGKGKKIEVQVDVKDQEQWDDLLAKDGLVVADVYAGWCGPCKAVEYTFRRIRNESGDDLLHFATADTDHIESLSLYRDKSRPTFLFFGGGELVHVIRGCDAPSLIRSITRFLKEEHKILKGEAERKPIVDLEVQQQEEVEEEKEDEERIPEVNEDEEIVMVEVPKEISVAIIKPDALQNGYADEIIRSIEESGIEILHREEKVLSREEAAEFYKQHEGSDHFEQLIEFMSSGPVMTLVLSKKGEDAGYGLIPELRDMIGPKDVNLAKEEAPNSIRAQYGTDSIMNAVHACDSSENAARELAFFFPDFNVPKVQEKRKRKRIQRTLALIRPDAYMQRRVSILGKIQESGFTIAMSKEMQLTREQAEEFYSEHKDQDYFESLINNMTSGPSLALCLAREDAVEAWRHLLGPKNVAQAKEEAPDSLRAVFSEEDATINPLHGADTPEAAENEIHKFFPPQSTVAVIKPEAYSIPDQREQIVEKIHQAGFKISAQKEINLTKELAAQFYKEHEGKDFYDGLTDYMSSGPSLFLILSKEDAVPGFRALVGPTEPDLAKENAPNSLRAQFATDAMKNAIHSSSNVEKAKAAIEEFFPEVELNEDGTVKEQPKEDEKVEGAVNEDEIGADGEDAEESDQLGDQQSAENGQGDQVTEGESREAAPDTADAGDTANTDAGDTTNADGTANADAGDTTNADGTANVDAGDTTNADGTADARDTANEKQDTTASDTVAEPSVEATEESKDEGSKPDEVNNNENADAKPDDASAGAKEANKEESEAPDPTTDQEGLEQANTVAEQTNSAAEDSKVTSGSQDAPQSDPQTGNTETDNNGTEENNNGEDVNSESKPEDGQDNSAGNNETSSSAEPVKTNEEPVGSEPTETTAPQAEGTQEQSADETMKESQGMPASRALVVSGPSGCGKSTIIKRLMKDFPNKFGFSVSHTTRKPRPGEVDGKDYHYTSKEKMQKAIDAGEFIESAVFSNNMYGTSTSSVQNVFTQGRICILDIDRQGVMSVKNTDLDCLLVFVKPPSLEELERRLRGRGTETEESVRKRLDTSRDEFAYAELPDSYDYVMTNDDLDRVYEEFKSIINKEIISLH